MQSSVSFGACSRTSRTLTIIMAMVMVITLITLTAVHAQPATTNSNSYHASIMANDDDETAAVAAAPTTVAAPTIAMRSWPAQIQSGRLLCRAMINVVGDTILCYIGNNGTAICDNGLSVSDSDRSALFTSISCGWGVCGIDIEGRIRCMMPSNYAPMKTIPFGSFTSVSVGAPSLAQGGTPAVNALALRAVTGTAVWFSSRGVREIVGYRWRSLSYAQTWACGLTLEHNQLRCIKPDPLLYDEPQRWRNYINETTWKSFDCGSYHCCGLLRDNLTTSDNDDGHAICIGDSDVSPLVRDTPADRRFTSLIVMAYRTCGRLSDGSDMFVCWGLEAPTIPSSLHASAVVDMECSTHVCYMITAQDTSLTYFPRAQGYDRRVNYYDRIWAHQWENAPLCAFSNTTSFACFDFDTSVVAKGNTDLQCLWRDLPPYFASYRIRTLSLTRTKAIIMMNDGRLYTWWCGDDPVPASIPPYINALRFADVCLMQPCFCGVLVNGTLICWCNRDDLTDNRDKPWTGGAIYDDFISIKCGIQAACAQRSNGEVYCWGAAPLTPPMVGPWLQYKPIDEYAIDIFIGVYHNHSVYRWHAEITFTLLPDLLNMSLPTLDFTRTYRTQIAARTCYIPYDGDDDIASSGSSSSAPSSSSSSHAQIVCNDGTGRSFDRSATPLMAVSKPLSVANQLTSDMQGSVCVLLDGQMSCVGGIERIRLGGWAMEPRKQMQREVQINPILGVNALFCGQQHFLPCQTLEYAMALKENAGIWITYVLASSQRYTINTPITIDWTGITIRPVDGRMLVFECKDICFVVNAPSFHISKSWFKASRSSAMIINAGLVDIVVDECEFVQAGNSAVQILSSSYITFIDSSFVGNEGSGACIYGSGAFVTVIDSEFKANKGECIYLTDSTLVVRGSEFIENQCVASGCAIYMSGAETRLNITNVQFIRSFSSGGDGGSIAITGSVSDGTAERARVFIHASVFQWSDTVARGGAIAMNHAVMVTITDTLFTRCRANLAGGAIQIYGYFGHLILTNTTFLENGAYINPAVWFHGGGISCEGGQGTIIDINRVTFDTQVTPYFGRSPDTWKPLSGPSGGAIYSRYCRILMKDSIVKKGIAHNGGFMAGTLDDASRFEASTFSDNTAMYGGVFSLFDVDPSVVFTNLTFNDNQAVEHAAVWHLDTVQSYVDNWRRPPAERRYPSLPNSLVNATLAASLHYHGNFPADDDGFPPITAAPAWLELDPQTLNIPVLDSGATTQWIKVWVMDSWGGPFRLYQDIRLTSALRFVAGTSKYTRTDRYGRRTTINPVVMGSWGVGERIVDERGTLTSGWDTSIVGEPGSIATYEVQLSLTLTIPSSTPAATQLLTRSLWSQQFTIELRGCDPGETNLTATSCDPCPTGRYSNINYAPECTPCAIGRYQPAIYSTRCDACDEGKIQRDMGGTTCSSCGAGKYASMEQSICHTCEPGRYSSGSSNGRCDACLSGTVSGDAGLTKCTPCFPGTYAINSTTCVPCPHGWYQSYSGQSSCSKCAIGSAGTAAGNVACAPCGNGYTFEEASVVCIPCTFGLTCENGMVTVSQNYWAYSVNETVHSIPNVRRLLAVPCPKGHCNGGEYTSANFTPCMINRDQSVDNVMCGRCEAGHSQFGAACIPCREVNCGYIMLTMLAIFVVAFGLHISAQGTSGIQATIIYFVQMAMFMLPSTETWLGWISIFSGGSTSVFGICIAPLTPIEQMVFEVSSMMLFMVALAIIFGIHWAMARWIFCGKCQEKLVEQTCIPLARYWRSFVSLYLFSFSTLANTLMGYMLCIDANNDRRIFTSPTLSCNSPFYNRWLPWVAILFIITIVIPPIALVIYLSRNRHRFNDEKFIGRWGQLYEPFSPRAFWWGIMVLFRRLIFTLVDIALVVFPSFKYMIFTMLHLLSLIIHVLVQPYSLASFNRAELFTLMSLTLLGIILSTFPTPAEITQHTEIRVLISFVVLAPILIFSIYAIKVAIEMIRNNCSRIKAIGQQVRDGVINGVDTVVTAGKNVGDAIGRKVKKPKKMRQPSEHKLSINDSNDDNNSDDDDSDVNDGNDLIASSPSSSLLPVHNNSSHGRTSLSVSVAGRGNDLRQPLVP